MTFTLNYPAIPVLGVGFTRANNALANAIRFFAPGEANHAFLVTAGRTQKFCTEETASGLVEDSLEKYRDDKVERIVAMYYWKGWDDATRRGEALDYLDEIRRRQGDKSTKVGKYDLAGLLSFVPVLNKFFKPDPEEEWCSENCASVHKKFGASWIDKTTLSPNELLALMYGSDECQFVLNYYVYPSAALAVPA